MTYSDQTYNLRIELDAENCELSGDQISHIERALSPLRAPVKNFPVADLYITIQFNPHSNHYRVKMALRLPGRALATGDLDEEMYSAVRRSVSKLVHKVTAYKHRLENTEETAKHEKGTHQDVVALQEIDPQALAAAVEQGDYAEFRRLTYPLEEPVRKRAGRWIQRYPAVEAELGDRLELADITEEVFLSAYERFDSRPGEVPFGRWLEQLIDPSVKLLSAASDEELENIRFLSSAAEAGDKPNS